MWREFQSGVLWQDLKAFLEECLEVNRDLLEGIKSFKEGFPQENVDMLRGRCSQIRDVIAFVGEMAEESSK
jgi:hypothetical protein